MNLFSKKGRRQAHYSAHKARFDNRGVSPKFQKNATKTAIGFSLFILLNIIALFSHSYIFFFISLLALGYTILVFSKGDSIIYHKKDKDK